MKLTSWKIVLYVVVGWSPFMGLANDAWLQDTIYVNLDETFGKYALHKVEKKQTLFSLANAYGIDLYDVYDYNPILKSRILLAGDLLRMPMSNDHILTDETLLEKNKKYHPVYYITKPKDNLYRISKIYFNMSYDELLQRNHLGTSTIRINQKLLIGWFDNTKESTGTPDFKPNTVRTEQNKLEEKWTIANPSPFTEQYKAIDLVSPDWVSKYGKEEVKSEKIIKLTPELNTINIKPRNEDKSNSDGKESDKTIVAVKNTNMNPAAVTTKSEIKSRVLKRRMVTQSGVAQWVKTDSPSSDLYVLHATAPVNSVVEITNPMTHRKIYAKVISNMPPKLYSDDISVVVSPGVANLLGVIDTRFYVKLRYVEETIQ